MSDLERHQCVRSESWELFDGRGIYCCRVCPKCVDEKTARYRLEIMDPSQPYTQADVDEPIEPEQ